MYDRGWGDQRRRCRHHHSRGCHRSSWQISSNMLSATLVEKYWIRVEGERTVERGLRNRTAAVVYREEDGWHFLSYVAVFWEIPISIPKKFWSPMYFDPQGLCCSPSAAWTHVAYVFDRFHECCPTNSVGTDVLRVRKEGIFMSDFI